MILWRVRHTHLDNQLQAQLGPERHVTALHLMSASVEKEGTMRSTFFIEAIKERPESDEPLVLDRIIVRTHDFLAVKKQAMLVAETAQAAVWRWPQREAVRVVDGRGHEQFRCQ